MFYLASRIHKKAVHDSFCRRGLHINLFACFEYAPPLDDSGEPSADTFDSPASRKKLIETASRREGIYNRTDERNVTFCGEEEQRNESAVTFDAKHKKSSQAK